MKQVCFLLLLFPFVAAAQTTIKGTIKNQRSKEPIAYAFIGLIKKNKATNADDKGAFTLQTDAVADDTLLVSCVGYETRRLAAAYLLSDSVVYLNPKQSVLKDVVVRNYTREQVLNEDLFKTKSPQILRDGSLFEAAQLFYAPTTHTLLKTVRIIKNDEKGRFRIRVYDVDTLTMMPGESLLDSVVEVFTKKQRVTVDMKPYQIFIPGKAFYVAVEWLIIPENRASFLTTMMSTCEQKSVLYYMPQFGVTYTPDARLKYVVKRASGRWLDTNNPGQMALRMAATVMY